MIRMVLIIFFLLISCLCVFPAPEIHLWYVAILVTEFPWIFVIINSLLFVWSFTAQQHKLLSIVLSFNALIFSISPIIRAEFIAKDLDQKFNEAFDITDQSDSLQNEKKFSITKMITGMNAPQITPVTYTYATTPETLTLDFYPAKNNTSPKPCIIIVHGGSWAGGDNKQLPELNTWLANHNYNAAAINYRLAPKYKSPAAVEDVKTAVNYLKLHAASLNIDTNNFVLLGRSAGGQIALKAAYSFHDKDIKGAINFYGPADMVWGYFLPANPLVMDSRKVMVDYLGGTYEQVPDNYEESSPVESLTNNAPPTLMIHGKNDPLVAYEHEERMSYKLGIYKVKNFVLMLPWATHACDYTLNGPSGQLSTYTIHRFLKLVCKE